MKYLLLLKTCIKKGWKKIFADKLFYKCGQSPRVYFSLFFLALCPPAFVMMLFFQSAQKYRDVEQKVLMMEKVLKGLNQKELGVAREKRLEEIFQQAASDDSLANLTNSPELASLEIFKQRQEELKLQKPVLTKSEKAASGGLKEVCYGLARPLEVSSRDFIQLLQDIEGNPKNILKDQFFLKLTLYEKEITKGYTTFVLDGSLLKREK